MKLTVLGMAGSYPGPQSPASSYLVQADDEDGKQWSVVLDLGSGALGALQRHVNPFDVNAVFLSHPHPDHCADMAGYYVYYRYHPSYGTEKSQCTPVTVYGPRDTQERLGCMYGLDEGENMDGQFVHNTLSDGDRIEVGPLTIDVRSVRHPVEAFGFRIEGPSEHSPADRVTLAYTGDTDICDSLDDLAANVDLFLSEAAFIEGRDDAIEGLHLTGAKAGHIAERAGARSLVLTHIPAWNDPHVSVREAHDQYSGPISVAEPDRTYIL